MHCPGSVSQHSYVQEPPLIPRSLVFVFGEEVLKFAYSRSAEKDLRERYYSVVEAISIPVKLGPPTV